MNTQLKKIIEESHSKSDVARALKLPINGSGLRKVSKIIKDYDTSHFDVYWKNKNSLKYERIKKNCPVCNKEFETQKGHVKEKTTCSYSCSNTYYRSGENNPNYINGLSDEAEYRKICFKHHEKKCVICGEENIVEVHHYDGDHENNKPENLVPLCSTHHRYWHSRFRELIKNKIDDYVRNYIQRRNKISIT
jgi:hypothetical protein